MKNIAYTPEALNALKGIASYYKSKVNNQVATRVTSQIKSSIDELSVLPNRYPASSFSKNVRRLQVKKVPYTVYYSVEECGVLILEILHQRQDHSFLSERYRDK